MSRRKMKKNRKNEQNREKGQGKGERGSGVGVISRGLPGEKDTQNILVFIIHIEFATCLLFSIIFRFSRFRISTRGCVRRPVGPSIGPFDSGSHTT